jgi:hypothetical protein
MNVLIEHYKKAANGRDTEYFNGRPLTQITLVKLPIKFGFGSYNEPRKVLDYAIDVEDIIKITPEGELNMSDN